MTSVSGQLDLQNASAEAPVNLLGLTESALADFFAGLGEKPFRARQVLQWMHQRNTDTFAEMTDLSKDLRAQLSEIAAVRLPELMRARLRILCDWRPGLQSQPELQRDYRTGSARESAPATAAKRRARRDQRRIHGHGRTPGELS
jgi:hypothetical protein